MYLKAENTQETIAHQLIISQDTVKDIIQTFKENNKFIKIFKSRESRDRAKRFPMCQ